MLSDGIENLCPKTAGTTACRCRFTIQPGSPLATRCHRAARERYGAKSPKHFYAKWPYNPNFDPEVEAEESAAFTIGRAAHHLYLGEDDFALQFIERPKKLNTKDGYVSMERPPARSCRLPEAAEAGGRTVLTPNDIKIIRGMARSLADEPLAIDLLQGAVEQTLIAKDPETGIWLKARPDVIPTSDGTFADFKTTVQRAGCRSENDVAEVPV